MKDIKDIVNDLVAEHNTTDVYELCSSLDITVKYDPLGSTKGYFLNTLGKFFITLNNNLEDWERKVVLAHELAHALLHKDSNICFLKNYTYSNTNKKENEANEFAAHLLIRDTDLFKFSKGYEYITIEQVSKHFRVPIELVVYKNNIN